MRTHVNFFTQNESLCPTLSFGFFVSKFMSFGRVHFELSLSVKYVVLKEIFNLFFTNF